MENKTYMDKINVALDSIEKTLNQGIDKVKEGTAKGIEIVKDGTVKGAAIVKDSTVKGAAIVKDSTVKGAAIVKDSTVKGAAIVKDSTVKGAAIVKDSTVKGAAIVKDSTVKGIEIVKDGTNKGIDKIKEEALLEEAARKFKAILRQQLVRVEDMKAQGDFVDYEALETIRIGVCGGDGIGPIISAEARRVLEFMLSDLVESGKVEFVNIEGLTIENRIAHNKAIPDDVMAELKSCHIILKGPTTTPQKGSGMPNIESANVAMRKALDLFANIRPVKVPEQGINWTIFRENTEGGYAVGSSGFNVTEDLAVDFTITTKQGSDRIARLAYDYARKNGFNRVSLVTKANVIKTTDGNFLEDCHKVADLYPEITTDEWYADIMTAKLVDEKRRRDFQVMLLPNLYGDIISDEAAEFQGGVGTAGCANIGKKYAMFEAIHGSAPRMIKDGRGRYADPCSMLRACVMLLSHIGLQDRADKLERALDICSFEEKKLTITGRKNGATCEAFGNYVMETLKGLM